MAGRDDGEFELILGNKQLLSVLFIVIVLLGVFFAMGFLAGRSTGPGTAEVAKKDADQVPITVDAATTKASEPATPSPVAQSETSTPPPAETAPVQQAKAEPPKQEAPKQEPAKQEPPKAVPAKAAEPVGVAQTPPAGTYLQVAAVNRADAQNMLSYIGEKTKLRGAITPVPKSTELFRVLVGPLKSNEDMAAARTKLADIGIKTPYPVKY